MNTVEEHVNTMIVDRKIMLLNKKIDRSDRVMVMVRAARTGGGAKSTWCRVTKAEARRMAVRFDGDIHTHETGSFLYLG